MTMASPTGILAQACGRLVLQRCRRGYEREMMMALSRRAVLGGALAGASLAAVPAAAQTGGRYLASDIGALRRVLVHSILP